MRAVRIAAIACSIPLLACAGKSATQPSSTNPPGAVAESEGATINHDSCSQYLADAPPPNESGVEFMPVSDEAMALALAMVSQERQPRCAHYQLVHRILAEYVLDDPRLSFILWEHETPEQLLEELASTVNDVCVEMGESEGLVPAGAFNIGRTEILGRPVVLVDVIPPPVATTEAHMFAVVGRPWLTDADRGTWTGLENYFVLEHSVSQGPTHTVFGGWARIDGALTHLNMGTGPMPTPTEFVHAIGQNLCGDYVEARTRI